MERKGLFLVATPIGHRGDITLRALEVLKNVDCVACEDKRVTGRLLSFYDIQQPLMPYHDHNASKTRPRLLEKMNQGQAIALVSDAGTPLLSDPGYKLVQGCYENDIPVTVVPGASAPIAALCLSGLPPYPFLFYGFLPPQDTAREKKLEQFADFPHTMIFFEAPHRLLTCLQSIQKVWGNRSAAVVREITKRFETVVRDSLERLIAFFEKNPPLGEITLVIAGTSSSHNIDHWDLLLQEKLETLSVSQAVSETVKETGLPKRLVYQKALSWKKNHGSSA